MLHTTIQIGIDQVATGLKLKELIRQSGYRTNDIMDLISCSAQAIFRWYEGKSLPSLDHMVLLSELLEVDIKDLLVLTRNTN